MRSKNPETMTDIIHFVDDYYSVHGSTPSTRIIAAGIGSSKATVYRYLLVMNENGMISYDGNTIVTERTRKTCIDTVSIPIVGSIACGIPNLAEENIEEYVSLPESLFGKGDFSILRANGNSMIDAGINNEDLVIIRVQSDAEEGQIVVALVDNEATLKRFYKDKASGKIILHPENSELEDIIVDNCVIQGVAVKVIKDL